MKPGRPTRPTVHAHSTLWDVNCPRINSGACKLFNISANSCHPDKAPVVSDLLDTLYHPVRREVIYYFEQTAERDGATLDDLVRRLDERMSESADQLRITLPHTHLSKLEKRGWLEYDSETDQVVYHGHQTAKQLLGEVHDIF